MDPSGTPETAAQRAMLSRLQQTAGNAKVARLLGEIAPPELRVARKDGEAAGGGATATAEAAPPGGTLLVANDVTAAGDGRMTVTAFLDAVEAAVTDVAAKELGAVFQVVGCPWVVHWIAYYRKRQPAEVEEALRRYAPAAAKAKTAQEYVTIVVARVRDGIAVWRATGQVPDVPADSPGAPAGLGASGASGADEGGGIPAFKMRDASPSPRITGSALGGRLGAGEKIDGATSGAVGAVYGADLSNVRIHRDAAAAQVVGGMGARAVTVGRDIAFAPGQYEPGTPLGDALIAHELAHVVQQTPSAGAGMAVSADTGTLERDADRAALDAVAARWGVEGVAGSTRRPPMRAAQALRAQSCIESRDKDAVFDEEAEKLAKTVGATLHRAPGADGKDAPVGFKPKFWLDIPMSVSRPGAGGGRVVKSWHVQEPGEAPRRSNGPPPGQNFSVEMDKQGEWLVYAKLEIGDVFAYLVSRQNIVALDKIADEEFKTAGTADYVNYRTLMNQERLKRAGGVDLDQSRVGGAYITNEGPDAMNPAPVKGVSLYQYAVRPNPKAPPDRKPVKYRWWAVPREAQMNQFTGRTDMGRRTEYNGAFAFYLGEGEKRRFSRGTPGKIEIVCELIDADDKLVDTASYKQMIMDPPALDEVKQVEKLMKEGAENYKKIQPGRAQGLKAMHVDARRGTSSDLTMFVGPAVADPSSTMLVDLTPGAEFVEHEGPSVDAAIKHLDDNNSYGEGQILIHLDGPPAITKRLKTTGETDLEDAGRKTGIGGMVLAGLGIVAGFTPLAPAAPYLIVAGLGLGAASGGMSLVSELRKAKPSTTKIAIDVVSIVGSLAGAGGVSQAIRMGSVELAMATATGRFFVYTGFAFDASGGVLLAADTAEKIEQIRKSRLSEEEKIDAIHKLILNLVVVGGLIAFGAKDVGAAKARVLDIVGEERAATLRPDTIYTLQALDDSVLQVLKKVPVDEFETVAVAMSKDSRRSAALSKAYGEKFVDEIRANPARSLEETGEILGAKAAGVEIGAVGGTRGADVYRLDPARGIGTGKERFKRGVTSTKAGRLHKATVDKIDVDQASARLEMTVGTETVAVSIELKETSKLSGGAHSATGGAGSGRIVELLPPPAGGKWTAKVELDAATQQDNVKFVLGHELDEIADFVATKGAKGSFKAEAEAGLFVSWADRASKTPPQITSHDRANAREYLNVAADKRALEKELAKKPADAALKTKIENRRDTLEKLTKNMGLLDPEHIELKIATLRKSLAEMEGDAKTDLTEPVKQGDRKPFDLLVDGIHRGVTVTEFMSAVAGASGPSNVTEALIAHLMRAQPPQSRREFRASGLHGGHHDAGLQEFIAANPEFALVLRNTAQSGAVTYRHYEQYRWNGSGPPPRPGDATYPTAKGPIDPAWEKAKFPKTTFDDPTAFVLEADALIGTWKKGLSQADLAAKMVGPRKISTQPDLHMEFVYEPPDKWTIKSIFIDAQWIAAVEQAAATPTPVPTGVTPK